MSNEDIVRDGLSAYWDAPSEYHAALDALVARIRELETENSRLRGELDAR